jgi:hypothetical protein
MPVQSVSNSLNLITLSAASTSWATHPEMLNLLVPVGGAGFEPALSHV